MYAIGRLEGYQDTEASRDWRALLSDIKKSGLYETEFGFYYREAAKCVLAWGLMVFLAVYGKSTAAYLLSSLCAAFLWHQAAFVAHDGTLSLFSVVDLVIPG